MKPKTSSTRVKSPLMEILIRLPIYPIPCEIYSILVKYISYLSVSVEILANVCLSIGGSHSVLLFMQPIIESLIIGRCLSVPDITSIQCN